jgi:hypothetical protein
VSLLLSQVSVPGPQRP